MVEKVTTMELEQMMDRMFSINPEDVSFFKNALQEIAKTDLGSDLLRSLDTNFSGKKLALRTQRMPDNGCFLGDESEIRIGLPRFTLPNPMGRYFPPLPNMFFLLEKIEREVVHGYPKSLFHELTHWNQTLHNAFGNNAMTSEDKFFTVLMAEADAQAAGALFRLEQGRTGGVFERLSSSIGRILGFEAYKQEQMILDTQTEVKRTHSDWSNEQIKKEIQKVFLKKVLTDNKAYWRRVYETPEMMEAATSDDKHVCPKNGFPDLMKHYMDKYGLTLEECEELKKEVLAQSGQKFSNSEDHPTVSKTNEATQTLHHTNGQILSQASASIIQPTVAPEISQKKPRKLDPVILAHLGGNDGKNG